MGGGDADSGRSEALEKAYSDMVLDGLVRFEKREYPYSHLEDELSSCMAWEIFSLFRTIVNDNSLYRNSINGNYMVKLSTSLDGKSVGEMKQVLEERLGKVRYGDEYRFGVQAVPVCVKRVADKAEIQLELVMPDHVRYANIVSYMNGGSKSQRKPIICIM